MAQTKECPKCAGGMVDGFVVDHTHGGAAVSSWIEGAPNKSIWVGLKLTGLTPIEITTWRCRRCGFIESYADGDPKQAAHAKRQTHGVLLVIVALTALLLIGVAVAVRLS
jgi:hypothetical protein